MTRLRILLTLGALAALVFGGWWVRDALADRDLYRARAEALETTLGRIEQARRAAAEAERRAAAERDRIRSERDGQKRALDALAAELAAAGDRCVHAPVPAGLLDRLR